MTSIQEYFKKDFSSLTTSFGGRQITITKPDSKDKYQFDFEVQNHHNFVTNTILLSYYLPSLPPNQELKMLIWNKLFEANAYNLKLSITTTPDYPFDIVVPSTVSESSPICPIWANIIYIYSEESLSDTDYLLLEKIGKEKRLIFVIRDKDYIKKRIESDKPQAFISYDSRDKKEFVSDFAKKLMRRRCTVWYDEYSLRPGDNLRESIEDGLKKCGKCIIVLSTNYLNNEGWTKTEFNSIFTRELIENKNIIIPIWYKVTKEEVYVYCPSLADKWAANTEDGIDEVVNKIYPCVMESSRMREENRNK